MIYRTFYEYLCIDDRANEEAQKKQPRTFNSSFHSRLKVQISIPKPDVLSRSQISLIGIRPRSNTFHTFVNKMKTIVLSSIQIERILTRIAYQIVEALEEENEIILVGMKPRGIWVAKNVATELSNITDISVKTQELDVQGDCNHIDCAGKTVILFDDIVNSGKSMMKAAGMLASANTHHLITACLVDRMHRRFPIHVDFTGQSLATTLQENLSLILDESPRIILE